MKQTHEPHSAISKVEGSVLVFVTVTVVMIGMNAGVYVSLHSSIDGSSMTGKTSNYSSSLMQAALALQRDSRFLSAENGSEFVFDANVSGILPTPEAINGTTSLVANLVFYHYGDKSLKICGLLESHEILGELEVRVPIKSEVYDLESIIILHYSGPFVYLCEPNIPSLFDAIPLEFHLQINYTGNWSGWYEYSNDSHFNGYGTVPWSGKGPAAITVILVGDIYAGEFLCASAQKVDGGTDPIALKMISFNRNVLFNSSSVRGISLCGGERIIFPR